MDVATDRQAGLFNDVQNGEEYDQALIVRCLCGCGAQRHEPGLESHTARYVAVFRDSGKEQSSIRTLGQVSSSGGLLEATR